MTQTSPQQQLELSWRARIGSSFDSPLPPDVLEELLAEKRSPNTRRAYRKDVEYFFVWSTGHLPTTPAVLEFLHLTRAEAVAVVSRYRTYLTRDYRTSAGKPLAEATVNRRLAALKSLVDMGRKLGVCDYSLGDIKSIKVEPYRDTAGITPAQVKKVLSQVESNSAKGKRDYAILRLLWGNALRRNELCQIDIGDLDLESRKLRILGKGKGSQYTWVDLSPATARAITSWLHSQRVLPSEHPLFFSLDRAAPFHRLSGESIRKLVVSYCQKAGISKQMSPHRIRHSAITAALDSSGGNVRKAQKLSRHSKIETLMIYDDNRNKDQLELSELLDGLVD